MIYDNFSKKLLVWILMGSMLVLIGCGGNGAQAPSAADQNITTQEDTAKTITLTGTAMAKTLSGTSLTYSVTTNPTHGTLSGTAPDLTYTPATDYNGIDSFTFKTTNGTTDSPDATVTITITAVNDTPIAIDQNTTTPEDTAKAITLSGTDVDGDSLTYSITTNPTYGTLSGSAPGLTYTPTANYHGTDSFRFNVNDCTGDSAEATIHITITSVSDAPISVDDTYLTSRAAASGTIDVLSNDTDGDGDTLTLQSVTSPNHGGTAAISGNKINYTPPTDYSGTETFDYTIQDTDGTTATATVTVTINKAWDSAPVLLENANGSSNAPQIAVNTHGDAIAVWPQSDGAQYSLYASHYTAATGWGSPALIENNIKGDAESPKIAMDDRGNAIAIWEQWDGVRKATYVNHYTTSTNTWGGELQINFADGNASYQSIAMDPDGNAIAVWSENTASSPRYNIWGSRYTPGGGWETAHLLEHDDTGDAVQPCVAMDANGNAIIVWSQNDGTRDNILATHYLQAIGWAANPQLIEHKNAGLADSSHVAFDGDGNAIAVWRQHNGTRFVIRSNRYIPGTGWEAASRVISTDDTGHASSPHIAMDSNDHGIAVWAQSENSGFGNNIRSNRYVAGSGWGTAQLIEHDDAGSAGEVQIAMAGSGSAVTVWQQSDGTVDNILSSHYALNTGWENTQLLEKDNTGQAWYPQVGMDSSGNAMAVWEQWDGARFNIYANRYW